MRTERQHDQAVADALRADNLRRAEGLCLCRDQPERCECQRRTDGLARQASQRSARFGCLVATGIVAREEQRQADVAVAPGGCAPPVLVSGDSGIPPGCSVLRGEWPAGVLVDPTAPPVVPDP